MPRPMKTDDKYKKNHARIFSVRGFFIRGLFLLLSATCTVEAEDLYQP